MAFDNLPGGLGTPAVLGVLILASFAGIALRHRMISRRHDAYSSEPQTADAQSVPAESDSNAETETVPAP